MVFLRDTYDGDDDGMVPDGGTVRRRMVMMDAVDAVLHRPGYRATDATARDAVSDAYDAMCQRQREAWKTAGRDAAEHSPPEVMRRHLAEEDNGNGNGNHQLKRDEAYRGYVDRMQNAWQTRFFPGAGPDVVGATPRRVGPGGPAR